jgi:hypothetical protein
MLPRNLNDREANKGTANLFVTFVAFLRPFQSLPLEFDVPGSRTATCRL